MNCCNNLIVDYFAFYVIDITVSCILKININKKQQKL